MNYVHLPIDVQYFTESNYKKLLECELYVVDYYRIAV
jgi:hypothetical protein